MLVWGVLNKFKKNHKKQKKQKIVLKPWGTLSDLEKALDVVYQGVLNKFDSAWGGASMTLLWLEVT
jgi:hypothetical protein